VSDAAAPARYRRSATPEICDYPDSGKFGVYAEAPPGTDGKPVFLYFMARQEMCLDYWAGEGGNPG
jgi:hypothetical protein